MKEERGTAHFALLDGLRGIAAIAVVLMHIGEIFILPSWLPQAYLAVPFFFILSGFVIAYAYEDGLMRRNDNVAFMLVRIERLYPMLLVGLTMGAILLIVQSFVGKDTFSLSSLLALLAAAIVMVPLPGGAAFSVLPPQWSLAIELWGNVIHCNLRAVLTTKVLVLALPLLLGLMAFEAWRFGGLGTGWSVANLSGGIATFGFSYGLGVLMCRLRKAGRLPRFRLPLWAIVLILIATLAIPQPLRTNGNAVRDIICAAIIYPLLLVAALDATLGPHGAVFANWLGRLSYPLYITHYPAVSFCCLALLRLHLPSWVLFTTVPFIATIALGVAWISLVAIDEPLRSWAKNIRIARARARISTDPA